MPKLLLHNCYWCGEKCDKTFHTMNKTFCSWDHAQFALERTLRHIKKNKHDVNVATGEGVKK